MKVCLHEIRFGGTFYKNTTLCQLTMFTELNLPTYSFRIQQQDGKKLIFDELRKKLVVLTPEEWVRQNFIRYLVEVKKYPVSLIAVEAGLKLNRNQFRADLLVYNRLGKPLVVAEFKAPSVKITQLTFDQISRYNMTFQVPYLMVSNGMSHYCCQIDLEKQTYSFLKEIPEFGEL
jgi:type I site-specific restriction endonuclease